MRAAFLSLATLALTAFAVPTAPAVNTNQLNELRSAEVASSEALHTFTKHAVKTKVKGNAELILVLQNRLDNVKHSTSSINSTMAQVKAGTLSKDKAATTTHAHLLDLQSTLTALLSEILCTVGIDPSDLDKILCLVVALVSEILCSVKYLLTILGVRPLISTILHAVFGLVASILCAVVGLVGKLLPGIIYSLSPLLATVGQGVMAPLTQVIASVLAEVNLGGKY